MSNYIAEALSRKQIRGLAVAIKAEFGLRERLHIPIVELLDVMAEKVKGFSYQVVDDFELPANEHAVTDIKTGLIKIKNSVYDGAANGRGRDRMTIAHEIAHFILCCLYGVKLARCDGRPKQYCDPEWQAKCFAGEFLIDAELTKDMTPVDIANECGVSLDAAEYQKKVHAKDKFRRY